MASHWKISIWPLLGRIGKRRWSGIHVWMPNLRPQENRTHQLVHSFVRCSSILHLYFLMQFHNAIEIDHYLCLKITHNKTQKNNQAINLRNHTWFGCRSKIIVAMARGFKLFHVLFLVFASWVPLLTVSQAHLIIASTIDDVTFE